jgi:tetratricopeptide (TPR) repeat protein
MNSRSFLIFCFLLWGQFYAHSQSVNLDSVKSLLKKSPNDTNKVNLLNILGWELKDSKLDESLSHSLEAISLAKKLGFKTGSVRALGNAGIAHYFKGEYNEALKYYIQAANLLDGTKYKKKQGAIFNNIALIYLDLAKYKDAEGYFQKSLAIDKELNDYNGMGDSYNNLGVVCKEQSNLDQAIDYFNQALSLRKQNKDQNGMASTLTNLGVVNTMLKNYTMAYDQLSQARELYKKVKDEHGLALTDIDFGDLYAAQNEYTKAIPYFKEGLKGALKDDIKAYTSYCYEQLSYCYSKINGFQQAYHYHVEFMKVKDTIYNRDNSSQLAEMQTKYETEKKEKELVRTKAESEKQVAIKNIFMISFFLMGLLAFFVFRGYSGKKKANKIIVTQKNLVEEKNREIVDSIQYAKRIQESLLPNEKNVERTIARLKEKRN